MVLLSEPLQRGALISLLLGMQAGLHNHADLFLTTLEVQVSEATDIYLLK